MKNLSEHHSLRLSRPVSCALIALYHHLSLLSSLSRTQTPFQSVVLLDWWRSTQRAFVSHSRIVNHSFFLFSLLALSRSLSLCLYDSLSSSYFLSVVCCSPHLPLSLSFSSSFLCVVLLFLALWLLLSQSMQTAGFRQHWICCFGLFCKKYRERICQNVWHVCFY